MSNVITRPTANYLTRAEIHIIMEAHCLSMAARARLLGISSQRIYDRLVMRLWPCRADIVARVRARLHALDPLVLEARKALAVDRPRQRRQHRYR